MSEAAPLEPVEKPQAAAQIEAKYPLAANDSPQRTLAAPGIDENHQLFRLLVEGVTDYAIYLLDPEGASKPGTSVPSGLKVTRPKRSSDSISQSSMFPRPSSSVGRNTNWKSPYAKGGSKTRAGESARTVPGFGPMS